MAVLPIIKYGSPILHKKAKDIKNLDKEIEQLSQNMIQTMYDAPGIGLAAPQVNQSLRLLTIDLTVGEKAGNLIILINPEILEQEGETILEEGCLSVPDVQEKVTRPARVLAKGIDLKGNEIIFEAEGLLARVFCHEIDHLNGKLFIDRLSPLKRTLIKKKLNKNLSKGLIK